MGQRRLLRAMLIIYGMGIALLWVGTTVAPAMVHAPIETLLPVIEYLPLDVPLGDIPAHSIYYPTAILFNTIVCLMGIWVFGAIHSKTMHELSGKYWEPPNLDLSIKLAGIPVFILFWFFVVLFPQLTTGGPLHAFVLNTIMALAVPFALLLRHSLGHPAPPNTGF